MTTPNTKTVRAYRVRQGDALVEGFTTKYVREVSTNSQGHIVLRCAYSPDGYPASSMILEPKDTVWLVAR